MSDHLGVAVHVCHDGCNDWLGFIPRLIHTQGLLLYVPLQCLELMPVLCLPFNKVDFLAAAAAAVAAAAVAAAPVLCGGLGSR